MRDLSELDPPSNSSAISSQSASDSQFIFDTTEEAGECNDTDISSRLTVTEKYQKDRSNSNMAYIVEENEMLKPKLVWLEKLVNSSSAEQHDSVKVLGHRESFTVHIVKLDENCTHYTGFPTVKRLKTVYGFLNPGNNGENIILYNSQLLQSKDKETRGRKRALSPFESYLLTLCRLKQSFSQYHLSYLFEVIESTVSNTISTWINFMYLRFGTIPIWPSRETVNKCMPESMRAKFPNVRVIIDCAEFKVETSSSLTLHKMMYSQYKHHTTVKSLLGIMLGGGFTFISPVFPGDT